MTSLCLQIGGRQFFHLRVFERLQWANLCVDMTEDPRKASQRWTVRRKGEVVGGGFMLLRAPGQHRTRHGHLEAKVASAELRVCTVLGSCEGSEKPPVFAEQQQQAQSPRAKCQVMPWPPLREAKSSNGDRQRIY